MLHRRTHFVRGRCSVVVGRDDLCSEFSGDPSSLDCEFECNIHSKKSPL